MCRTSYRMAFTEMWRPTESRPTKLNLTAICTLWILPVTATDPAKRAGGADYVRHRSSCGSADRITSWQPYRSSSGAPSMSGISSRTRASARGT
jgi:hypothetical protein